jgi:DNA repair exonuclease SbcCD ATPase subunit
MQLTAANRRDVIEDLLDISIFSSMGKLLKDRIAENKEDIRETEYQMQLVESKIDTHRDYIRKLKEQSDDTIATFQNMIDESEKEIQSLTSNNACMITKTELLLEKVKDSDSVTLKSGKVFDLINKLRSKHDKAHKRIDFFDRNDECPTCSQEIEDSIKSKVIGDTNQIIEKVKGGIQELEEEYKTLQERLTKIQTTQQEVSVLQSNVSTNQSTIKSLEKSVSKNQGEIQRIQSANADDTEAKDTLETLQRENETFSEKKEELINDRELFGVASDMLKDGGIKTKIIRQYVPIMNKLINKYLAALDFFVAFELDEEFNEIIKSRHRDEFSYASFSEGEKMRIDLALLFTWRAVAKLKNSTNTNLLILDEVFDASLDTAGCDEFLKLIHQLGGETNVFVISHKGDILSEKFRSQIRFEKVKNFSRIAA